MSKINTLVGQTTHLKGNLQFTGALHVDGRISGDVRADPSSSSTLSVSEHGCIEGAVDVVDVILDGIVTGPIRARGHVVLGPAARVYGDVHYGVIEMALGAEIKGKLVRLMPPEVGAASPAKVEVKHSEVF